MTGREPTSLPPTVVPALELGGTHCAATLIDTTTWRPVPNTHRRQPVSAHGTADQIIATLLTCANPAGAGAGCCWGVAVPGPFDYERGIGLFEGVGKFEAVYGIDLGAALLRGLRPRPAEVVFINDADAFLVGEWVAGAAAGHHRAVGVTLGTGVGSAFVVGGTVVDDGPAVPPQGRVDLLTMDGRRLEDIVSRRAIMTEYARLTGMANAELDVHDVAARDRAGEPEARQVLDDALVTLGQALAPWLERFGATVLVVGGGMAASWDVVCPRLHAGIRQAAPSVAQRTALVCAVRPTEAALIGAAQFATRHANGGVAAAG